MFTGMLNKHARLTHGPSSACNSTPVQSWSAVRTVRAKELTASTLARDVKHTSSLANAQQAGVVCLAEASAASHAAEQCQQQQQQQQQDPQQLSQVLPYAAAGSHNSHNSLPLQQLQLHQQQENGRLTLLPPDACSAASACTTGGVTAADNQLLVPGQADRSCSAGCQMPQASSISGVHQDHQQQHPQQRQLQQQEQQQAKQPWQQQQPHVCMPADIQRLQESEQAELVSQIHCLEHLDNGLQQQAQPNALLREDDDHLQQQQQQGQGQQQQQLSSSPPAAASVSRRSNTKKQRHPGQSLSTAAVAADKALTFRVANDTDPAALAAALLRRLQGQITRQQQQQQAESKQRAGNRNDSSSSNHLQQQEVLLSCLSSTSLYTAFAAVALVTHQAGQLQKPHELLLLPELLHNAVQSTAAGREASLQARYQLRLSWIPRSNSSQQQQQHPQQQQQAAQELEQQQQQQADLKMQQAFQLPLQDQASRQQHWQPFPCDPPGSGSSPQTSSSSSSSSAKSRTSTSSTGRKHKRSNSRDAAGEDSSSKHCEAACKPNLLSWQLVGFLRGSWPAGLSFSSAAGALVAFKALVKARRQLAAGGLDLFVAVHGAATQAASVPTTAAAAAAAACGSGSMNSSSSSSLTLWAVACPAAATAAVHQPAEAVVMPAAEQLLHQQHQQRRQQRQQTRRPPSPQQTASTTEGVEAVPHGAHSRVGELLDIATAVQQAPQAQQRPRRFVSPKLPQQQHALPLPLHHQQHMPRLLLVAAAQSQRVANTSQDAAALTRPAAAAATAFALPAVRGDLSQGCVGTCTSSE